MEFNDVDFYINGFKSTFFSSKIDFNKSDLLKMFELFHTERQYQTFLILLSNIKQDLRILFQT